VGQGLPSCNLTDQFALFVNQQFRITGNVDEQDVPNFELEIGFRMSGHIPLRPSDYMPYTLIYQQNFAVIRLYDGAGKVIAPHDHTNEFREL
jgi:hypothetical protein